MASTFDIDVVSTLLSEQRMRPYLTEADGDPVRALDLYAWGTSMSAAAFETVAHLEVLLRNTIDAALSEGFHDASAGIPWFLREPPANAETAAAVSAVRERLRPLGHDTRHQVVAGLSFGFWSGMLGRRYEDLWRSTLRHAFPGSSGTRKQVATEVEAIRKFRNRLAHHDSMLGIDIPFETARIQRVAEFIHPDAAAWLRSVDRTAETYASRPVTVTNTVVVPARSAWSFYESHRAYVCQAGRTFRPVDRIAFYADQEIKPDVPRIRARRDDVLWSEEEATRLAASPDRDDRKIAAIISASIRAGWTDGVYQVFLLSGPGAPEHRQLGAPLPHRASGRGSAFVQRQRYVSLHALETAASTEDLD